MSKHPLVLTLHFLLELAAWAAMGYWGWSQHEGILQVLLGIGLPLVAMVIWGVFRVPNDPKTPPVQIPGWLRLLLEAATFGGAVGLLIAANRPDWALALGIAAGIDYVLSYDRVLWLVRQ